MSKRYHSGEHISPKCSSKIKYRSLWEKAVCLHLDDDPQVQKYEYETLKLAYRYSNRTQRVRFYIPDFVVWYKDGSCLMVEVKPKAKVQQITVLRKKAAGEVWASQNKAKYQFWTEDMIFPLLKVYKEKLNEVKELKTKRKRKKTVSTKLASTKPASKKKSK